MYLLLNFHSIVECGHKNEYPSNSSGLLPNTQNMRLEAESPIFSNIEHFIF